MSLTKEEILSKVVLKKQTVTVPEWGGDVIVSEMSGAGRDQWEQSMQDKDKAGHVKNPRAKLVIATVVDENGNRLFTNADVDAVGNLSSKSLCVICDAAQRLNFLLVSDLDEAEKN